MNSNKLSEESECVSELPNSEACWFNYKNLIAEKYNGAFT